MSNAKAVMPTDRKAARKWEMAAFAFVTGFSAHAHTSSSMGVIAGTLAVCALVVRARLAAHLRTAPAGAAILA